ncbi:MAG: 3-methyl-2-oxobutanoate dehydrogenase [Gemmatimonadetes bacterium]|nr:3-methyl-2-oxobutanoate dehydrogenase [Gemmatimonadota bacterium]
MIPSASHPVPSGTAGSPSGPDGSPDSQVPLRVLSPDGGLEGEAPDLSPTEREALYRQMSRLRAFDNRMINLQRQGRIGFYGPATGQEATTVGSAFALEAGDWIFPALREAGALLVRGYPLRKMVAQLYGNRADDALGHQMPCHYTARELRFVSMSSCIANQLPQAVGAAWAARIRGDRTVVLGYIGDGGTSEGDFHAAMNFAGVFRTPCVILCQNNRWAISVPVEKQTAVREIARKAAAYGIPGLQVDGNDVLAVVAATRAAADRARCGGGPTFIEALTYRAGPHTTSDDPTRYRASEEAGRWPDPIPRYRAFLEASGAWDEERERGLQAELEGEIDAAIEEVEAEPAPDPASLIEGVFATPPALLRDQLEEVLRPRR